MNTTVQALLIIMIILLGTTLTLIGVQLFLILKEVRSSVEKFNKVLLNVEKVSNGIATGAEQVTEALDKIKGPIAMLAAGKRFLDSITRNDNKVETEETE